ncbi:hypothetical protein [Alicyclobacillus sacchari]|uniref:hypothetical protein n=1 Tax=Alicyclobacillus sacchari TaxID=392010 RepID=UPI0024E14AFA|nr:hypothetical protein [Alicyclobacillus sacchari]
MVQFVALPDPISVLYGASALSPRIAQDFVKQGLHMTEFRNEFRLRDGTDSLFQARANKRQGLIDNDAIEAMSVGAHPFLHEPDSSECSFNRRFSLKLWRFIAFVHDSPSWRLDGNTLRDRARGGDGCCPDSRTSRTKVWED